MKIWFKSGKLKGKLKKVFLDKFGILDDVFDDFVEVVKFDLYYNLFKNLVIKFRNYLIV